MGAISSSLAFSESLQVDRRTLRPYIRSFDKLKCDVHEFAECLPFLCLGGGRCSILVEPSIKIRPQILLRPMFWRTFEFINLHKILIKIVLTPSGSAKNSREGRGDPACNQISVVANVFEFYYVYKIMNQIRMSLLAGAAPQFPSSESGWDYEETKSSGPLQVSYVTSEEECPICCERRQEIVIDTCLHTYCNQCYHEWKEKGPQATCPMCRIDLKLEVSTDFWQLEQWNQSDLEETLKSMKETLLASIQQLRRFTNNMLPGYVEFDGEVDVVGTVNNKAGPNVYQKLM